MDIKLTKQTKNIKVVKEHTVSIDNIETTGVGHEFIFRSVQENGELTILFPFGKKGWSKKPRKEILEALCVSELILIHILKEFITYESDVDEIIVSLNYDDFRGIEDPSLERDMDV